MPDVGWYPKICEEMHSFKASWRSLGISALQRAAAPAHLQKLLGSSCAGIGELTCIFPAQSTRLSGEFGRTSFLIPHCCFKAGRMSCHSNLNVSQPGLSTLLPQQFAVLISRMFVITARGSVKTKSKPGELGSFASWLVLLNTLGLISSCFSGGEKYLIQWI